MNQKEGFFYNEPKWLRDWRKKRHTATRRFRKLVAALPSKPKRADIVRAAEIHSEVFNRIDCLQCGNCCRALPAKVNRTDARRLSSAMGCTETHFLDEYTQIDEDADRVLRAVPCMYLEDNNQCQVYGRHPRSCQNYPHTDGIDFFDERSLHLANAQHCPAVWQILEAWESA